MKDYSNDPAALNLPWPDSPFLHAHLAGGDESADDARLRSFHEEGFLVVEDLFDPALIDRIVADYPRLFDPSTVFEPDYPRPPVYALDPNRRQDAWVASEPIRELACHPDVLALLESLYRRRPIPFQTLNFMPGSQQAAHSDSIHFSSLPNGFMCGVWVALEDTTEDNGPLFYYPKSHRLPVIGLDHLGLLPPPGRQAASEQYSEYEDYVRAVVEAQGFEEKRLIVKKGTCLVWAANLLHGGSPVRDPDATRKSQVTHYYFDDCIYYAPIVSYPHLGEFRLKQVYDIGRDECIEPALNGQRLDSLVMKNGRVRFAEPETFTWAWLYSAARQKLVHRAERFLRKRGYERAAKKLSDRIGRRVYG